LSLPLMKGKKKKREDDASLGVLTKVARLGGKRRHIAQNKWLRRKEGRDSRCALRKKLSSPDRE